MELGEYCLSLSESVSVAGTGAGAGTTDTFINARNSAGRTALFRGIALSLNSGYDGEVFAHITRFVKVFVERGGDINVRDGGGNSVVHIASRDRNLPLLQLLFDNGGDPDLPNGANEYPFFLGLPNSTLLFSRSDNLHPKPQIQVGNFAGAAAFQLPLPVVNFRDNPLDFSNQFKSQAPSKIPAFVDAINRDFSLSSSPVLLPPLSYVIFANKFDINEYVNMFLKRKFDMTVKSRRGDSLLHISAKLQHMGLFKAAFAMGLDPNALNDDGQNVIECGLLTCLLSYTGQIPGGVYHHHHQGGPFNLPQPNQQQQNQVFSQIECEVFIKLLVSIGGATIPKTTSTATTTVAHTSTLLKCSDFLMKLCESGQFYFLMNYVLRDFTSIKKKLEERAYDSHEAFVEDVRLVFQNAIVDNSGMNIVPLLREMSDKFEEKYREIITASHVQQQLQQPGAHDVLFACSSGSSSSSSSGGGANFDINHQDSEGNTIAHLLLQQTDADKVTRMTQSTSMASSGGGGNIFNSALNQSSSHSISEKFRIDLLQLLVRHTRINIHLKDTHGRSVAQLIQRMHAKGPQQNHHHNNNYFGGFAAAGNFVGAGGFGGSSTYFGIITELVKTRGIVIEGNNGGINNAPAGAPAAGGAGVVTFTSSQLRTLVVRDNCSQSTFPYY